MLTRLSPRFLTVQLRVAVFPSTADTFLTLRTPEKVECHTNSYIQKQHLLQNSQDIPRTANPWEGWISMEVKIQ